MVRPGPIGRLVSCYYRWSAAVKPNSPFHNIKSVPSFFTPASVSSPMSLRRVSSRSLMFGSLAAFAATGRYVSYAFTSEEVHDYAKHFRESNHPHYVKLAGNINAKSLVPDEEPFSLQYNRPFTMAVAGFAYKAMDFYHKFVEENFESPSYKLLPDSPDKDKYYTLVLDLNDTLVHSDWIGNQTFKRPGLDAFLERVNELGYEVVLYTDKFSVDVNYLLPSFKNNGGEGYWFKYVRTRGSTKYKDGKRYRDLSRLNRDPSRILYVSGHALENCLQPENCVAIKPWKKEVDDTTLTDLLPFLEYVADELKPRNIRRVLSYFEGKDIATTYVKGSKIIIEVRKAMDI